MTESGFLDVFGTPGGLSLGFEMAGFKSLGVIDNDKYGLETYTRNFPNAQKIELDARSVGEKELQSIFSLQKNIDVVVGGPPCQGFSIVGRVKRASIVRSREKKGHEVNPRFVDDPRNALYKEFVRIVNRVSPKFFVMENVLGLASYKNGRVVQEILEDFEKIGFKTDFSVLDSSDFGVPQRRKRIFFIGNSLGLRNLFPQHKVDVQRKGKSLKRPLETVRNAIGDLPRISAGDGAEVCKYDKKPMTPYQKWARRGSKSLHNHVARWHSDKDIYLFKHMMQGQKWADLPEKLKDMYGYRNDIFLDKMKRLTWDEPAWTVVSHLSKDGYLYIHPKQHRTITVREAARLQSFPDRFIFEGPRTSQFHQVGRAVPPLLAKAVARVLKRQLQAT